jgi:hypothetical protein
LLLVGSRAASLRPAPLLPFVARDLAIAGFAPTSSEDEVGVGRLDPSLPVAPFPT